MLRSRHGLFPIVVRPFVKKLLNIFYSLLLVLTSLAEYTFVARGRLFCSGLFGELNVIPGCLAMILLLIIDTMMFVKACMSEYIVTTKADRLLCLPFLHGLFNGLDSLKIFRGAWEVIIDNS